MWKSCGELYSYILGVRFIEKFGLDEECMIQLKQQSPSVVAASAARYATSIHSGHKSLLRQGMWCPASSQSQRRKMSAASSFLFWDPCLGRKNHAAQLLDITRYHNILQHITTYHNISQHITTYYNISQHITTYYNISEHITTYHNISHHITTYHNILQHIRTYHNILQHITTYNISQHITTYHNILQHIRTYHNILQHITTYHNIYSSLLRGEIFSKDDEVNHWSVHQFGPTAGWICRF